MTSDYITNVNAQRWDSEPDLFYFNFLGKSGAFILDENGVAVLMPYQNIKISGGPAGSWTIKDEAGTIYTFGADASSCETSTFQSGTATAITFKSSWYLSTVTTANNDDVINFSYLSGTSPFSYKYFIQTDATIIYSLGVAGGGCTTNPTPTASNVTSKDLSITINTPVYLSAITTSQAKVSFYGDVNRDDLPGAQRILRMIVTDNQSNQNYGFNFH